MENFTWQTQRASRATICKLVNLKKIVLLVQCATCYLDSVPWQVYYLRAGGFDGCSVLDVTKQRWQVLERVGAQSSARESSARGTSLHVFAALKQGNDRLPSISGRRLRLDHDPRKCCLLQDAQSNEARHGTMHGSTQDVSGLITSSHMDACLRARIFYVLHFQLYSFVAQQPNIWG